MACVTSVHAPETSGTNSPDQHLEQVCRVFRSTPLLEEALARLDCEIVSLAKYLGGSEGMRDPQ